MDDEIAGYRFKDARLLEAALTHTSYVFDHPEEPPLEDFERLEFLGDAIVGFCVGAELYERFRAAREGELTQRRAQVVSRASLADVGDRLGLIERARLGKAVRDKEPRFGFATRLYETLAGAIYLDGGLEAAREFIRRTLADRMDQPVQRSPKTDLQELTQRRFGVMPTYRQIEVEAPPGRTWFTFEAEVAGYLATGEGRSMREAQENAAAKLLKELEG